MAEIMTVQGSIAPDQLGFTLMYPPYEHGKAF